MRRRRGLRSEVDDRPEKMGFKIREAEVQKVPCMASSEKRRRREHGVDAFPRSRRHWRRAACAISLNKLINEVKNKGSQSPPVEAGNQINLTTQGGFIKQIPDAKTR